MGSEGNVPFYTASFDVKFEEVPPRKGRNAEAENMWDFIRQSAEEGFINGDDFRVKVILKIIQVLTTGNFSVEALRTVLKLLKLASQGKKLTKN